MADPFLNIVPAPKIPGGSAVHVWRLRLDLPAERLAALEPLLCPHERDRAGRFRFERDRTRFVAAHSGMRMVLSSYLRCQPQQVDLVQDGRSKPLLRPSTDPAPLRFNLSHSGDWALLAVGQREIGVDIEQVRLISDLEHLAASVLAPSELAVLTTSPERDRLECFFRIWTRKEAAVKAIGAGLAAELRSIEIEPADPARAEAFQVKRVAHSRLSLYGWSFDPLPGYHAALVLDGLPPEITHYDWPAP